MAFGHPIQGKAGRPGDVSDIGDELESFERSTAEYVAETRVGGGTPNERRMADAFGDLVKVFRALNDNVDSLRLELRELRERVDAMDTMRDDFERVTGEAAERYMREYAGSVDELIRDGSRAVDSIKGVDTTIGTRYAEAVDDSARRMRHATSLCIGCMALCCACMCAAAWVWTWGEASLVPWVQEIAKDNGWLAMIFWMALTGVSVGGIAFVATRWHRSLEKAAKRMENTSRGYRSF